MAAIPLWRPSRRRVPSSAAAGGASSRDLQYLPRGDVRLGEPAERSEECVSERRADDDALEDALHVREGFQNYGSPGKRGIPRRESEF
jgi:hypothetical protein